MKRVYVLIVALVAALFLSFGCSTNAPKSVADLGTEALAPWTVDTPNPLLAYVPSDAPFMFATQRSAGNSTDSRTQLLMLLREFDSLRLIPRKFVKNYRKEAPSYGLDPDGKTDAVAYLYNGRKVFHFTVTNESLALSSLDKFIIDNFNDKKDDNVSINVGEKNGWKQYIVTSKAEPLANFKIDVRSRNNVMTLVISELDQENTDSVLTAAKSSWKPVTIKDAVFVSHLDYAGLGEFFFKIPRFASLINGEYLDDFPVKKDQNSIETLCSSESELCRNTEPGDLFSTWRKSYYDQENDRILYTPEDWIRAIKTTSISDDVCIAEYKSIFSDFPSVDLAVSISATGKFGYSLSGPVASKSMIQTLEDLKTEYMDLNDDPSKTYGHLGFSIYDASWMILKKMLALFATSRNFKCAQLDGFLSAIMDEYVRELKDLANDDDFRFIFRDLKSASFTMENFPIFYSNNKTNKTPSLLMNMRNALDVNRKFLTEVYDVEEEDIEIGKPFSYTLRHAGQDFDVNISINDSDVLIGTKQYDLSKKFKLVKGSFATIHLSSDFMHEFASLVGDLAGLDSAYHIDFDLKDGRIFLVMEPTDR